MYTRKRNKTRLKIKNAFSQIVLEKEPSKISISEICETSNINRSTFYEYFSSIDDLIDEVIFDQVKIISRINRSIYDSYYFYNISGPENVKKYINNLLSSNVLISFIKSKESRKYKSEIIQAQYNYEVTKYNVTDLDKKMEVLYRNSGILLVLFRWIEKQIPCDIDTISEILYKQISKDQLKHLI